MDLNQRFAEGGEAELEELIAEYKLRLIYYAKSILYNHQDAEDAVQDTFILAYKNRRRFDGRNLQAWLYKITYNLCINKRKAHKILFLGDILERLTDTSDFTANIADHDFMIAALGKIGIKDRAILYMRIMENLSYDEISEITGRPQTALRKQFERAKKKVAANLEKMGIKGGFENA